MTAAKMFVPLAIAMIAGLFPTHAEAGERWDAGRWRLELSGLAGLNSGRRSRTDDYNINILVDYEVPINKGVTVGLRLQPLFFYKQDGADILGAGFGPVIRWYQKQEEYEGFFVEFGVSLMGQSKKFEGNTGSINFLSELGFGYAFPKDWHVALKMRHLSNAGIAEDNSGVNGIGIGFGYRF